MQPSLEATSVTDGIDATAIPRTRTSRASPGRCPCASHGPTFRNHYPHPLNTHVTHPSQQRLPALLPVPPHAHDGAACARRQRRRQGLSIIVAPGFEVNLNVARG